MRILRGESVISSIRNGVSQRQRSNSAKHTGSGTYSRILSYHQRTKGSSSSNYISKETGTSSNIKDTMYQNITYTAAKELNTYAEKLTRDGRNSLFYQAEKTGDTTEIVSNVTDFVKNYNNMVSCMSKFNLSENSRDLLYFSSCADKASKSLNAVGITVLKGGKLTVDPSVLKNSSIEDLKNAFNGNSSFGKKILERSSQITKNTTSKANNLSTYQKILKKKYYDFSV
ncbi:hypothetical protein [Sinanaerobacter sp. ZZT-01]|uniref:hypothetical protein n=1 Tax=Sinanaerobacter sp. ZZT-01 TaxID=3111540 RepID=UPI002D776E69|nr:hypothetical protein [Sinanaerobacter sp. ZZT-01]WRR93409.1 hypothetical protein U5921_15475 [Sinanaerobacter sp. ZZT-01]